MFPNEEAKASDEASRGLFKHSKSCYNNFFTEKHSCIVDKRQLSVVIYNYLDQMLLNRTCFD